MKKKKSRIRPLFISINIIASLFLGFSLASLLCSYIFNQEFSFFGLSAFIISSDTMEPDLRTGSLAIIKRSDPKDIEAGDLLTYKLESDTVIHKVIEKDIENGKLSFIAKANTSAEPFPVPIKAENVLGVCILSLNGLGTLLLFLQNPKNFTIFLVGLTIIFLLPDFIRYIFRKSKARVLTAKHTRQIEKSKVV
jgi:signal peptidase